MNLRSAATVWSDDQPIEALPLAESRHADVVIIGSGVSGALAAYHLTQSPGRSVVMIDKSDVAQGSVAASTALLQYEIDTTLVDLSAPHRPAAGRAGLPTLPGRTRPVRDDRPRPRRRLWLRATA